MSYESFIARRTSFHGWTVDVYFFGSIQEITLSMSHMDRQNSICLSTFGRSSVWILCQQVSHYPSQNTTTTGKQDRRQGLLQTIQTRLALSPSSLHSLRSVPFQGQFFVAAGEASALRGIYHHQVGTAVRLYVGLEYVLPSNAVVVAGDTSRNQAG